MHKIFANSLFLGKKVVFLPQCHSTNEELAHMVRNQHEPEGLIVLSDHQLAGRGQRGNSWIAESGKNILMSLLLRPKFLAPSEGYQLNMVAGLAVLDAIENLTGKRGQLKWPNDVFVNDKKNAGILIETNISRNAMQFAVVGIGLNVNQELFGELPATSLKNETGVHFDRWEVMTHLVMGIEKWYQRLRANRISEVMEAYYKNLRWLGEHRIFASSEGEFSGKIVGIDGRGCLIIETLKGEKTFEVKEVRFIR